RGELLDEDDTLALRHEPQGAGRPGGSRHRPAPRRRVVPTFGREPGAALGPLPGARQTRARPRHRRARGAIERVDVALGPKDETGGGLSVRANLDQFFEDAPEP